MNRICKSYGSAIKTAIAVICLLCLLLSFGAVTASAKEVNITASSCKVERGSSASITFKLQDNPGIHSLILKVEYNASAMTLASVDNGNIFPDSEIMLGSFDKNPFTYTGYASGLINITTNGLIVTFNFTVSEDAAFNSYPVKITQATGFTELYERINFASANGSISVVKCLHTNTEWKTTVPAKCEENGTETLTCKKCGEALDTRTVKATNHKNTEIRNAVPATKTSEGYTGDKYCKDCNKLISKGKVIAKLKDNPTATSSTVSTNPTEPQMTSGNGLSYVKNSDKPLVFVSDADIGDFVQVTIDGSVLNNSDYTVKSGSTIVTVNADYLNKLGNGEHTVSIVSKSGTASTKFTVQNEAKAEEVVKPLDNDTNNAEKSSPLPVIIIVIVLVVLLVCGTAAVYVIRKRRYM